MLQLFGDAPALLAAGPSGWRKAGVPLALHGGLAQPDGAGIDQDLAWLRGPGRTLLPIDDPRYPQRLREIAQPPLALFCQGDPALLARPQIALVGARAATRGGLETAEAFAGELTRRGLVVSSGLALGIDGAAHRGALGAGGPTVAVCGTGLDRVYPARHRELAHEIATNGVLVSEFPTGTPPLPEHFPRRNRILSGLALGVLVVEAAPRSGSLVTARLALEQGREVFAIPGSIHSPLSRGGHELIRQGAKLVENVDHVIEELARLLPDGLPPAPPATGDALAPSVERSAAQQRVLDAVGFEPTPFDALVERLGMPVGALSAALFALEMDGAIATAPGGAYQRLR
ncbi:MAG TPA: DNA-processing protein DprA [Candidatus Binatia bacterium]|nr:DNA-processing protein DprA [Candidatus Binatia bacterium]